MLLRARNIKVARKGCPLTGTLRLVSEDKENSTFYRLENAKQVR
jgi:hypothetical protein